MRHMHLILSVINLLATILADVPRAPLDRPRAPISKPVQEVVIERVAEPEPPEPPPAPPRERLPRVVFFHASWCAPCRSAIEGSDNFPKWLKAAGWDVGEGDRDHVQLIDVDKHPVVANYYGVSSLPCMVLVDGVKKYGTVPYNGKASIPAMFPQASFAALRTSGNASAPTPYAEVVRVLNLLPKPETGFVDFGCGSDARWCIVAAEKWGCRATGVEIDHDRAVSARDSVKAAGVSDLVTIIEGDAITTDVSADVGVAYLYGDTLSQLKPRIEKLRAFASYMHQPAGLPVAQNGNAWIYVRQAQQASSARTAVWGGQVYAGPVCANPRCAMCNSIRAQLGR